MLIALELFTLSRSELIYFIRSIYEPFRHLNEVEKQLAKMTRGCCRGKTYRSLLLSKSMIVGNN